MKTSKFVVLCLLLVFLLAMSGCNKNTWDGEWTILSGEHSMKAAETLKNAINKTGVVKASVVTECPTEWTGRLILVGDTGEDASTKALLKLKESDYLVEWEKEYIVIAGGSVEKTEEAVDYVCEKYMSYLEEKHDLPFGTEYNHMSCKGKKFLLNGVTINKFKIVASNGNNNESAVFLQDVIKNLTGTKLEISNQAADEEYCIRVVSGKEGVVEELGKQQYHIYQDEKNLYLCSEDANKELLVAKMFCMKYLEYIIMDKSSALSEIILDDLDFKFTCNWEEFTAPEVIQSKALMIPVKDGYDTLQGGCTDGTYAYYIMNDHAPSPDINLIYKVDLATLEIVQVSEQLDLQHANSITYNSKRDCLIVVNLSPDKEVLTYVDPDTLTMTGTEIVDFYALSLAYNAERDAYVAGSPSTVHYFLLDSKFNVTKELQGIQTTTTKQEVEVLNDKVMFGMSGSNLTYVYDWDGEFLYTIDLKTYQEFENVVFYGDYAYIGYNITGGLVNEAIYYQELD